MTKHVTTKRQETLMTGDVAQWVERLNSQIRRDTGFLSLRVNSCADLFVPYPLPPSPPPPPPPRPLFVCTARIQT